MEERQNVTPDYPSTLNPQPLTQSGVLETNPPMPLRQKNVRTDREKIISRRWMIESIAISSLSFLVLANSLLTIVPVLLSSESSNVKFFFTLVFGIPALFGLLILRRSDMARLVVIVFMSFNIAFQFLPSRGINLFVIVLSSAVIIFLGSDRIKRHFI